MIRKPNSSEDNQKFAYFRFHVYSIFQLFYFWQLLSAPGADTGFKWGGARFISEQKIQISEAKDAPPTKFCWLSCFSHNWYWEAILKSQGGSTPRPWLCQEVQRSCLYPPLIFIIFYKSLVHPKTSPLFKI